MHLNQPTDIQPLSILLIYDLLLLLLHQVKIRCQKCDYTTSQVLSRPPMQEETQVARLGIQGLVCKSHVQFRIKLYVYE